MTTTQQPAGALAIIDPRNVPLATQVFGEERLQLLAEQVGRGWKVPPTPAELEVIALICQQNRFNIFAKPPQVHFIKRWDNKLGKEVMTPQTSIDGMRLVASRNRDYLGPAGWFWCGDDGVWKDIWLSSDPPRAARAGVLKRGSREPMYAVALWDEWAQYQDVYAGPAGNRHKTGEKELAPFWASKPSHMLAKTAEMIVLKQAFPAETDKFEIAHLEELDRLEIPARVAMYERIYGGDEEHAFAELPAGKGAPPYALQPGPTTTEVDGRIVDTESGEVLVDRAPEPDPEPTPPPAAPPPPTKDIRRGETLELYGALLTQARHAGVIAEADMPKWALTPHTPEVAIISKGRELRALLNANTLARASSQAPKEEAEPESAPPPPAAAPKPEMVSTRSALGQKMALLVEEAARLEVQFDDCQIEFPAAKESVLRLIEKLEDRVEAKKRQLAGTEPLGAPLAEQPTLEDTPSF